eukprot:7264484-Prymnesium_polylepis.1
MSRTYVIRAVHPITWPTFLVCKDATPSSLAGCLSVATPPSSNEAALRRGALDPAALPQVERAARRRAAAHCATRRRRATVRAPARPAGGRCRGAAALLGRQQARGRHRLGCRGVRAGVGRAAGTRLPAARVAVRHGGGRRDGHLQPPVWLRVACERQPNARAPLPRALFERILGHDGPARARGRGATRRALGAADGRRGVPGPLLLAAAPCLLARDLPVRPDAAKALRSRCGTRDAQPVRRDGMTACVTRILVVCATCESKLCALRLGFVIDFVFIARGIRNVGRRRKPCWKAKGTPLGPKMLRPPCRSAIAMVSFAQLFAQVSSLAPPPFQLDGCTGQRSFSLPLLPFGARDVMLPGETKELHLYEPHLLP